MTQLYLTKVGRQFPLPLLSRTIRLTLLELISIVALATTIGGMSVLLAMLPKRPTTRKDSPLQISGPVMYAEARHEKEVELSAHQKTKKLFAAFTG